jgi:hypothetical protein
MTSNTARRSIVLRVIQGHPIRHASATIVANQNETSESELVHHVHQFPGHRPLGVRKVVIRVSGYCASAVGAQVDANHGVISREFRREKPPHQARSREAVNHENWRAASISPQKDLVPADLDFSRLELCRLICRYALRVRKVPKRRSHQRTRGGCPQKATAFHKYSSQPPGGA